MGANAEAVDFAAVNQRFRLQEIQFREPLLQKVPRLQPLFLGGAVRFGLIGAKKDMPPIPLQSERRCDLL